MGLYDAYLRTVIQDEEPRAFISLRHFCVPPVKGDTFSLYREAKSTTVRITI